MKKYSINHEGCRFMNFQPKSNPKIQKLNLQGNKRNLTLKFMTALKNSKEPPHFIQISMLQCDKVYNLKNL